MTHRPGRRGDRPAGDEVSPQLDDVEGVPTTARPQFGSEVLEAGIQRVPDRLGHEAFDGRLVEPLQPQPCHAADAPKVGETGGEWLGELVARVPERADDEQTRGQRRTWRRGAAAQGSARPPNGGPRARRPSATARRLAEGGGERLVQPVAGRFRIERPSATVVVLSLAAGEQRIRGANRFARSLVATGAGQ